ncbi:hypothetical protein CBR_g19561 [Chara braunii]|uniref:Uncharacterized protein n=1 Tax=Chara braunii TaxID=69332 RepID=A0A388KYF4_CHABU|nr:hypothetical protein CBR_g19561 [Chara braunii]|eukprot:GBG75048.1 hypothetical protein CBR_g19561 [Chara braunii]
METGLATLDTMECTKCRQYFHTEDCRRGRRRQSRAPSNENQGRRSEDVNKHRKDPGKRNRDGGTKGLWNQDSQHKERSRQQVMHLQSGIVQGRRSASRQQTLEGPRQEEPRRRYQGHLEPRLSAQGMQPAASHASIRSGRSRSYRPRIRPQMGPLGIIPQGVGGELSTGQGGMHPQDFEAARNYYYWAAMAIVNRSFVNPTGSLPQQVQAPRGQPGPQGGGAHLFGQQGGGVQEVRQGHRQEARQEERRRVTATPTSSRPIRQGYGRWFTNSRTGPDQGQKNTSSRSRGLSAGKQRRLSFSGQDLQPEQSRLSRSDSD